jgi:hypothetical protein
MRHLCKNFIEDGRCTNCRKPEWAIYFPEFKHKIGSRVKLPLNYTCGGKEFIVLRKERYGYVIGKTKNLPMKWFDWWEMFPLIPARLNKVKKLKVI